MQFLFWKKWKGVRQLSSKPVLLIKEKTNKEKENHNLNSKIQTNQNNKPRHNLVWGQKNAEPGGGGPWSSSMWNGRAWSVTHSESVHSLDLL